MIDVPSCISSWLEKFTHVETELPTGVAPVVIKSLLPREHHSLLSPILVRQLFWMVACSEWLKMLNTIRPHHQLARTILEGTLDQSPSDCRNLVAEPDELVGLRA